MKSIHYHLFTASIVAWTSASFLSAGFSVNSKTSGYGATVTSSFDTNSNTFKISSYGMKTQNSKSSLSSTAKDNSNNSANSMSETNQKSLLVSQMSRLTLHGPVRLILASQSPRRREILDMMGLAGKYHVRPSPLDETALQIQLAEGGDITPKRYTQLLAESKARALVESGISLDGGADDRASGEDGWITTFVLGSDTIVDLDGTILEKPKNKTHAVEMLQRLSGSWHEVHTGVSLYRVRYNPTNTNDETTSSELAASFVDTARVKFANLGEEDIRAYVATGEPMDKAGSYGIQGVGGQFVERIEGDFFTVMGLPMHPLSRELAKAISATNVL